MENWPNSRKNFGRRMTKADVILLVSLLITGLVCFAVLRLGLQKNGAAVRILSDGELYGTYYLTEEQNIPIQKNGKVVNVLEISGHKAKMIKADCPDKLCVHQKAISRQGETIVCLPNKIVVEIEGDKNTDTDLDSISR